MIIFLVLINIVVLMFITGIIIFIIKYRRRKVMYESEKAAIAEQYKLDLLNAQLLSQKQTMEFIGQEIHDSIAQKLTLVAIYVQQISFENFSVQINQKLTSINSVLNDSLEELRYISKDLTGNRLQAADLNELMEAECNRINAIGICTASCKTEKLPDLNIAAKSSIYRIVQEFLQNSIKHSGCSSIQVKAVIADDNLLLKMEDDGKGFEVDKVRQNGIGLDNIRRRVRAMDGNYNFVNNQSKGVCLNVSIPLKTITENK